MFRGRSQQQAQQPLERSDSDSWHPELEFGKDEPVTTGEFDRSEASSSSRRSESSSPAELMTPFLFGAGIAALYAGVRFGPAFFQRLTTMSTFYKGGFEEVMSRREAALILGLRDTNNKTKIRDAHRRIMLLNHPDKGGSPYIAIKINEAKALLEKAGSA